MNRLVCFCSCREEDVTVTMYTAAYERNKVSCTGSSPEGNKVDKICDAVREALKSINENK